MSKPKHYFTTHGEIRGSCGHAHRTAETAMQCLTEDQKGCESQCQSSFTNGYSDRAIYEVSNKIRKLVRLDSED